ncbi:MAG: hypothetical protein RIC16_17255 [Rhodospirillales bacterium]
MSSAVARVYDNPEEAKKDWPKTPDGTIDWEVVFEVPGTGLIPLVSSANNHDLLFKLTANVIQQLFTRKGDRAEVERFLHELTKIITAAEKADSSVESTRTAVVDLLRRIKQGRIDKAAAYVAAKKLEQQDTDAKPRRRRTARRNDDRKLALRKRIMLMSGGGLAAALLVAGVVGVMILSSPDNGSSSAGPDARTQGGAAAPADAQARFAIEDSSAGSLAVNQLPLPGDARALNRVQENALKEENGLAFSAAGYPQGTLSREDIPNLAPHVMTLDPILFSRNIGGGQSRQRFILPVLSIRDPDSWRDICAWGPSLTEAINAVMMRQLPQTGEVADDLYVYAGEIAAQMINSRLGTVLVDKVYLLYNVDRRLTDASARCRPIEAG